MNLQLVTVPPHCEGSECIKILYVYILHERRAHMEFICTKSHFSTTASCNISFYQAQQGRPQTQFLFGVVPSLVVFSQHRLFSSLMVQALQVESSLQRLAQSRRPSDLRARPPLVLRPPLMYVPSVISQPGQVKSLHTRRFLNINLTALRHYLKQENLIFGVSVTIPHICLFFVRTHFES